MLFGQTTQERHRDHMCRDVELWPHSMCRHRSTGAQCVQRKLATRQSVSASSIPHGDAVAGPDTVPFHKRQIQSESHHWVSRAPLRRHREIQRSRPPRIRTLLLPLFWTKITQCLNTTSEIDLIHASTCPTAIGRRCWKWDR